MDIGIIGLGKMGANMAARLLAGGHRVVVFDLYEAAIVAAEAKGAVGVRSLDDLAEQLQPPRAVWLMVPSGKPTEDTLYQMSAFLTPGDTLIDGGNSNY
ncbi:MAG: NAD(P)-binding domain-containing protein, partial [Chloroflexota bacterium]|nr:NAD(P)-binding domain-containing protein [Chloroflexota bacterium]